MLVCPGCHMAVHPALHNTPIMHSIAPCPLHQTQVPPQALPQAQTLPLQLAATLALPQGLHATQPSALPAPPTPAPASMHGAPGGTTQDSLSISFPLGQFQSMTSSTPPCTTHCLAHLLPGVQTPYVCGRRFQVPNGSAVSQCLGMPHSSCQMLWCVVCPHACPVVRPCQPQQDKVVCPVPRTSLHTSGGGIMEDKERSVSPEAKVNYPASIVPFKPLESPSIVATETLEETWTAAGDSRVLSRTRQHLEDSGWYYGALSWQGAAALLKDTAVGTFLVRDSASPACLYSLSVQTANGPTSVRIHYSRGVFRLDCTGHSRRLMPEFPGVVELAQHYVSATSSQVWVDHEGKTFSPINMTRPKRHKPASLQHLCRLALNKAGMEASKGVLPPALRGYLDTYPHTC